MSVQRVLDELGLNVDEGLLLRSLTHTSYVNENPEQGPSNERLEFLGDAVLEAVVSDYLFDRFPDADEGHLTLLRSSVVRTETLAAAARKLKIGRHLRLGRGEECSGGRRKQSLLADAFEAVVAAVYLTGGFPAAGRFTTRCLLRQVSMPGPDEPPIDAKSLLDQRVQQCGRRLQYRVADREGPDHDPRYTVEVWIDEELVGRGRGSNKQAAEVAAAEQALMYLDVR